LYSESGGERGLFGSPAFFSLLVLETETAAESRRPKSRREEPSGLQVMRRDRHFIDGSENGGVRIIGVLNQDHPTELAGQINVGKLHCERVESGDS